MQAANLELIIKNKQTKKEHVEFREDELYEDPPYSMYLFGRHDEMHAKNGVVQEVQ